MTAMSSHPAPKPSRAPSSQVPSKGPAKGSTPTPTIIRGASKEDRDLTRLLAILFMGLAHLTVLRQRVKGAFFALIEVLFILAIPSLVQRLSNLVTLGEQNLSVPVMERDNSMFMLIDGVLGVAVILVFATIYAISVRSALQDADALALRPAPTARQQVESITSRAFPTIGLMPMLGLILFFVVVPLVFSAAVAFTNYSAPNNIPPANTVDWVGLETFKDLLGGNALWTGALVRVFGWTLVWAIAATITCYFGGMLIAVILQESKIRIKPVFRAIFILPYAVPAVITMLVWRNMLNGAFGAVNKVLLDWGIIDAAIPWLSDPLLAKFVAVAINLWAGFPYFMLLTLGAMTAISPDIKEAAELDGASKVQQFRRITLPLVLYQTAPLLIMSFAANFNNFGAIFFLTGGGPTVSDTTQTGAGGTDIMVTWIYSLTIDLQKYNYGAALAVMIFLVLAPVAIMQFRRTKSFKGEL